MRARVWWIVVVIVLAVGGALLVGRVRPRTGAPVAAPAPGATASGPGSQAASPAALPVEAARVQQGAIERRVAVSGSVTSVRLVRLFARRSGQVAAVLVQEGDRVAAGQALVQLDTTDAAIRVRQAEAAARAAEAQYALVAQGTRPEQVAQAEEAVRQARAQVRAAEARLALLRAGARPQEREQARQAVRQAESALATAEAQRRAALSAAETAEASLQRMETLLREGAVAQVQVDQARLEAERARAQVRTAEAQVAAARAQLESARQQASLVESGPRAEEVQAAEAQVAQARAALRQAEQALLLVRRGARAAEVAAAAAQRDQARAVLAEARQVLADLTLRAPFAGRVAQVRVARGDLVTAGEFGQPVVVVYDDRALEAEVTVGEREAALVRPGQPAALRAESAGGAAVSAVVRTVALLAQPGSRTVSVRLRLVAPPPGVLPGTFVRGAIVVERRRGVLTVPRAALRRVDGRDVVWLVEGGVVRVRPVAVGLTQDARVEVRRGVRAGDLVVTLGPEAVTEGTRVTVVREGR